MSEPLFLALSSLHIGVTEFCLLYYHSKRAPPVVRIKGSMCTCVCVNRFPQDGYGRGKPQGGMVSSKPEEIMHVSLCAKWCQEYSDAWAYIVLAQPQSLA